MIARGFPAPERGFIIRPGSDGARIIRRESLRLRFQPAHVIGVLVILVAFVGSFFGPSIIDGVRTAQVVSYAESVIGVPLVVEDKYVEYSYIEITLVGTSTGFCDAVNERDDNGLTKLQSYKTREGGCRVEVYEEDTVWATAINVNEEPFAPILVFRVLFLVLMALFGAFILSMGREFVPSQIADQHDDALAEAGTLKRYVIGDGIDDQTIWDAVVREREAARLERFSARVVAAIAATRKQKIDGTAAYTESKRLRNEIATMLSGEN